MKLPSLNIRNVALGAVSTIVASVFGAIAAPALASTLITSNVTVVHAVNAGGGRYTAADGTVYSADRFYRGGTADRRRGSSVAGTRDDELYTIQRYGNFTYDFPVSDGVYSVTLKMAEPYFTGPGSSGKRVFSMNVEDESAFSALDLSATVGSFRAYDVVVEGVRVSDGKLTVTNSASVNNATIAAIVVKAGATTVPPSGDQCDTTRECQATWPNATDCADSRSDSSVCMCGSSPCAGGGPFPTGTPMPTATPNPTRTPSPPGPGVKLGRFDTGKDLLLANFDMRPDVDDVHSAAALATMLKDPRFANVKFHAVMGAFGTQFGQSIDGTALYNIAFGRGKWSNRVDDPRGTLNTVSDLVIATLRNGGDIWIQEAGQSDFSADLVRRVKRDYSAARTTRDIHIVQHSDTNQRQTTAADLAYVRAQTDYNKISDGNIVGNGSPGYKTNSGDDWNRVVRNSRVGNIWREARSLANANNGKKGHTNSAIQAGGFDFSDASEDTWIFGFNGLRDSNAFFDEFLSGGSTPPPPPPSGGNTWVEDNGLVVVEMTSTNTPNGWTRRSGNGATGNSYMVWLGGDRFNSPGTGTVTIPVRITDPGRYRFNMRNVIDEGNDTTEANDVWLKINGNKFYGEKSGAGVVCPKGKPASNRCSGGTPNGAGSGGWLKVYRSGGPASSFVWKAFTSDNNAHEIFVEFNSAGTYNVQLSGRSNHHGIDRFVLYRDGNGARNVSDSFATSNSRPESRRQ